MGSVFALVSCLIEYRLLAIRMVHVTCRPIPAGFHKFDSWSGLMHAISVLAVACNVAIVVLDMRPMMVWPLRDKFIMIIALEHAMLGLKGLVYFAHDDDPYDTTLIEDFNAGVLKRIMPNHRNP